MNFHQKFNIILSYSRDLIDKLFFPNIDTTGEPLDEREVNDIFNAGNKDFKNFSCRLLRRYFTGAELVADFTNVLGTPTHHHPGMTMAKLDPIRVGFIRKHLTEHNDGTVFDEKKWMQCVRTMNDAMLKTRKRKSLAKRAR